MRKSIGHSILNRMQPSRRHLLRSLSIAALPLQRLWGGPDPTGSLSAFMASAATRALPAEVVEKTKHHILDTFAAMISGSPPLLI